MKGLLAAAAAALIGTVLSAQGTDNVDIRDRLRARYDLAALQDGLALIPRNRGRDTRLIEVRDGIVSINGDPVTARELRNRIDDDADLVLRLTYLTRDDLRRLAAVEAAPAAAPDPAAASADPPPVEPERRRIRREEIFRFGGDVSVGRDEEVDGDIAVFMGSGQIDGEVNGDVHVFFGSLALGPEAEVHGDVDVVGGSLTRSDTARIDGAVQIVGLGDRRAERGEVGEAMRRAFVWRAAGLGGTLLRIALLILLTLVVVAFGPGMVGRIADRAAADPVRAGLVGLMAEVLFVPLLIITIIVLAVSIVGIPLLLLVPFGIILALVMVLVGFTGVACQVGRTAQTRLGWGDPGRYTSVIAGVLVIAGVTLLARTIALVAGGMLGFPLAALGYLVEYVAWTIGAGAIVLTWHEMRRLRRLVPPPLPGPGLGGA